MNKLPSPEQTARLERQRLAVEEGTKALQEVAERAIAIRRNGSPARAETGQGGWSETVHRAADRAPPQARPGLTAADEMNRMLFKTPQDTPVVFSAKTHTCPMFD